MTTTAPSPDNTTEHARLAQATGRAEDNIFESNPWYEWGPYLSERAWGTVREDYSDNGDAWSFFPQSQETAAEDVIALGVVRSCPTGLCL
jgi:hypothetical protein